jgi:hypothetical protein
MLHKKNIRSHNCHTSYTYSSSGAISVTPPRNDMSNPGFSTTKKHWAVFVSSGNGWWGTIATTAAIDFASITLNE